MHRTEANDVRSGGAGERERAMRLPRLLTASETADILRTSRAAVYAMAERGQLPGVIRLGRRLLVDSGALVDFLNQKRAPSKE
jgi:predicted DNA-binding transcriptional regulator AlpA